MILGRGDLMRLTDIQSAIVSCFFSHDLKQYIEENDYRFSGKELLSLADHFAPTYQEKMRFARLISETDDEAAPLAKIYEEKMTRRLDAFLSPDPNAVYELTIQDTPDAYPERYLCADFDTALNTIDRFYETYANQPSRDSKCTVEKRKILTPSDNFQEDVLCSCILTARKAIRSIEGGIAEWDEGDIALPLPEFPAFLPSVSPVKYISLAGNLQYGVYVDLEHPPTETAFIIPFDTEMMKTASFKALWPTCGHTHIPCPDVESIPLSILPAHMQETYFSFVAWWEEFSGRN